jgi:SAM-dependent methyltransferase
VSNDPGGSIALDDYRWLTGPEGTKWFEIADSPAATGSSLIRLTQQLRAELSPARVHLLLQQRELRTKAREKFPHTEIMFFTPRSLEQATDAAVAAYKAGRFLQTQMIADLCCGIGGDLLALARRGPVIGVDRDPIAVLLAQANAQAVLGRADACRFKTRPVDAEMPICSEMSAWHIDPDRRPGGSRTTRVKLHDPGPDVLARLLNTCPNGAIKLAPAADLVEPWWAEAELEWISRRRQCRQLVAWFGTLAEHPGRRRATVVRNASDFSPDVAATFVGEPQVEIALAPKIGRYVFEPDPAVLASKLEGNLARKYEVSAVAPNIAYFTGDRPISDAAFDGFEVLEVLPYHVREIKEWLTARHIGRLEIKKRGVPLEPEKVRRELAGDGVNSATLLLAKIGGRVQAIVARRLEK